MPEVRPHLQPNLLSQQNPLPGNRSKALRLKTPRRQQRLPKHLHLLLLHLKKPVTPGTQHLLLPHLKKPVTPGTQTPAAAAPEKAGDAGNATPAAAAPEKAGDAGNATPAAAAPEKAGDAGNATPAAAAPEKASNETTETAKPAAAPKDAEALDRDIDFTELDLKERTKAGLNDRDRAVLHLGGRDLISRDPDAKEAQSIYFNVLGKDGTGDNWGNKAEVSLVKELKAKEEKEFGGVTGSLLHDELLGLHTRMTGDNVTDRYADREIRFASEGVDITSNVETLEKRHGMNRFEQGALRLYGHEPLLTGGKVNGQILAYTVGNDKALDGAKYSGGNAVDDVAKSILEADMADGKLDGDALNESYLAALDKALLGKHTLTAKTLKEKMVAKAQSVGRTAKEIGQSMGDGAKQAVSDAKSAIEDNPGGLAAGLGATTAAMAICPYLGGLSVAGATTALDSGQESQAHATEAVKGNDKLPAAA